MWCAASWYCFYTQGGWFGIRPDRMAVFWWTPRTSMNVFESLFRRCDHHQFKWWV